MNLYRVSMKAVFVSVIWIFIALAPSIALGDVAIESPVPSAEVSRAQFTTGISNREPVDKVVTLDNSETTIYYFTELRNLEGRTVFHRWEHAGRVISEVPFEVGGSRWRVFSKKTLKPAMTGKWTVLVLDQSGWPIHAGIFEYKAAE